MPNIVLTRPKSRCQNGYEPLEALEGKVFLVFFQSLEMVHSPWLVAPSSNHII